MERLGQKKKLDEFIGKWFHDKAEGTLIAAFHPFDSPSDFEILVENHLRRLIDRQLPGSVTTTSEARAVWKKGLAVPRPRLRSSSSTHRCSSAGRAPCRTSCTRCALQAADGRSFVLILGMSGGGKSSVVRAGVLPMLTRPGVIEDIGFWRRAVFRPTDVRGDIFRGPGQGVAARGRAAVARLGRARPGRARSACCGNRRRRRQRWCAMLSLARRRRWARRTVVSRWSSTRWRRCTPTKTSFPEHREAFVDVIDAFARSGRVWVICTLRSDFYPRLANLPKLAALKEGAGQYDLMPPTANEIGQMIRLPTRAAGLRFEEDSASSERLDDKLRDAAAEHPEILPLLQFTLEELYQRRTDDGMLTLAAYRELGGVEGSLAQRAETVFKDLPEDVQAELPKILNALVSIEQDGHETIGRKRAPWSDFASRQEPRARGYVRRESPVRDRARGRRQRGRDGGARSAALALAAREGLGRSESREPAHPRAHRRGGRALEGRRASARTCCCRRENR